MNKADLLAVLPTYGGDRDIIVPGRQKIRDIIKEVLNAHERYAGDYDQLVEAGYFDAITAPEDLFHFCQSQLKYIEEPRKDQTTRSPAGIIVLSDVIGVDCKHYAGFIAGVLDALNRAGYDFDWHYCFVSYNEEDKKPEHVFVICDDYWIDPAPVRDIATKRYYPRSFDDRMAVPVWPPIIKKPSNMLSSLHGINYVVVDDEFQSASCGYARGKVGCPGNRMPDRVGQFTFGFPDLGADPVGSVQQTAADLASLLPEGGLSNFLKSFFENPTKAIITLIKGRTYTKGGYQLGEIFMRNILGMSEIQSNWQVPDQYVPIAEQFFTLALGVEIGSGDHLNELVKSADAYYAWMPVNVDTATPRENAERASQILQMMNYGASIRDRTWPLSWFERLPYVYPIPDVEPGSLYTGTHPITNIKLESGFPAVTIPIPTDPGSGEPVLPGGGGGGGGGNGQTPPETKAGFGLIPGILIGGLALTALMAGSPSGKKKNRTVKRSAPKSKKRKRSKSRR